MILIQFDKYSINVQFFGGFSLKINGKQIDDKNERSKRVLLLIEYLIANRHNSISIENLANEFWNADDSNDSINALKNLVYRARKLLKELANNQYIEFIQFTQNTYRWNNDLDCYIDIEQFICLWTQGTDASKPDIERLESLEDALNLYCGNFIDSSPEFEWIHEFSSYYSTIFIDCVLTACNLLIDMNCYSKVISICESALQHVPFEIEIHKLLLKAFVTTGQLKKAFEHYTSIVNSIYKTLPTDATIYLHHFYNSLINDIEKPDSDFFAIKKDLIKSDKIVGAYYCDYDIFKSVYHIVSRSLNRTGKSIFIVLFTLCDSKGKTPSIEVLEHSSEKLLTIIMSSLRKGDLVTPFSATQLIIMLSPDDYEGAEKVANRILQKFNSDYRQNDVIIKAKISAIDPVE